MNIAIIQARVGSTRLPAKVLKEIEGKPLLAHVIERAHKIKNVQKIIIATTTAPQDDAIVGIAASCNIEHYRGSEDDVLSRYYEAAKYFAAKNVIRITADCPLLDPVLAEKIITKFMQSAVDYLSNTLKPTFPDGLDVEVFSFSVLEKAFRQAAKTSEREHVTAYIWSHPELFELGHFLNAEDLSKLRWTVDTESDFEFVTAIYKNLYQPGKIFLMEDVLKLLSAKPDIAKLNAGFTRNEGYGQSLAREGHS